MAGFRSLELENFFRLNSVTGSSLDQKLNIDSLYQDDLPVHMYVLVHWVHTKLHIINVIIALTLELYAPIDH